MEHNFTFIVGISVAFIFFIGIFVFLIKKNVFGTNEPDTAVTAQQPETSNEANSDADLIEDLKRENKNLNAKLAFMEVKMEKMEEKVKELKATNHDLEEHAKQLHQSKRKLEELQVQKDELFSIIVHDLKNPASAIKNFIELLESYDLNAQEQQEIMHGLLETSTHILSLADEVSKIMSVEKSNFKLELGLHNINDAALTIINRNLPFAQKKKIKLTLTKDDSLPQISMDFNKIKDVIDNLVNNAIKFAPEGARVEVITKRENDNIILEVIDNGFGLSQEDVKRAFEKGSKLSTRPTGGESSSGLGLWIAKRIIEEHKGRVWVKSKQGEGSTFAFSLPIA